MFPGHWYLIKCETSFYFADRLSFLHIHLVISFPLSIHLFSFNLDRLISIEWIECTLCNIVLIEHKINQSTRSTFFRPWSYSLDVSIASIDSSFTQLCNFFHPGHRSKGLHNKHIIYTRNHTHRSINHQSFNSYIHTFKQNFNYTGICQNRLSFT